MRVRVVSKSGNIILGGTMTSPLPLPSALSVGGNRTVYIRFDAIINGTSGEDFYIDALNNAICVWGQGLEYPDDRWHLHPEDAKAILNV